MRFGCSVQQMLLQVANLGMTVKFSPLTPKTF
jgi:hypothetical protein